MNKILFIISIFLSFFGWVGYVWLSILIDRGVGKEYFSGFPSWLAGVYKIGTILWVILPMAVMLLIISGYLKEKKVRVFSLMVLILDLIFFMMSFPLFI